jgi:hypothetical protein
MPHRSTTLRRREEFPIQRCHSGDERGLVTRADQPEILVCCQLLGTLLRLGGRFANQLDSTSHLGDHPDVSEKARKQSFGPNLLALSALSPHV